MKPDITVDDIVEGMARAATLTRLLTTANITPEQLIALAKGEAVVVPVCKPKKTLTQIEAQRALCDSLNISYPDWASDKALATLKARP